MEEPCCGRWAGGGQLPSQPSSSSVQSSQNHSLAITQGVLEHQAAFTYSQSRYITYSGEPQVAASIQLSHRHQMEGNNHSLSCQLHVLHCGKGAVDSQHLACFFILLHLQSTPDSWCDVFMMVGSSSVRVQLLPSYFALGFPANHGRGFGHADVRTAGRQTENSGEVFSLIVPGHTHFGDTSAHSSLVSAPVLVSRHPAPSLLAS